MSVNDAFRKMIRSGLNNPDIMEKRMGQLLTALNRQAVDGTEHHPILDLCKVLEDETKRAKRNQADKAQSPDGPTRQTVRKLKQDPVLVLLARGTINKDDEKTIQELRELRFKITMGLTPGGGGQAGEKVDTSTKTYTHPIERLTARQDKLFIHVYKPWAAEQNRAGVRLGKRGRKLDLTPFNLVVAIIEDSVPLAKMETHHKVRNGSLSRPFTTALRKFADALRKAEHEGSVPRCKS